MPQRQDRLAPPCSAQAWSPLQETEQQSYRKSPAASEGWGAPPQDLRSREALAQVFADLNKYAATTHLIGQSAILTLTSERATGEACCLAHHVTVDGSNRRLMVASLSYLDTFVKAGATGCGSVRVSGAALAAFSEVESALAGQSYFAEQLNHVMQRREVLRQSLEHARNRYDAGYAPYLDQLDAQRNLYEVENEAIAVHQSQLENVVDLYKALGGRWDVARVNASQASSVETH
jgi:hypothetical protein